MARRVDRSRIEQFQRCPRSRWWGYEFGGRGVQSTRLALPLITGSAVHAGLEHLLSGNSIDQSVIEGTALFQKEVAQFQLDLEMSEDQFYVAQEQMALVEALLRCFEKTAWRRLSEEFEVVDVEREEEAQLAEGLNLMGRVDAVVRERSSDDLYVWSFKTTSTWDKRKDKSAEHDQQGLSEAWLVEQRTGQKVMGVQMVHFLKGRRAEHPKGSGRWITFSPLIRGYKRHSTVGTEYAHSWEWEDEDGGHRLGGKWDRFDVWTDYGGGVKQWVDDLEAGVIQPQAPSPLEAQILTPMPYFRQPEDIENWLEQTIAQETRIAEAVDNIACRPEPYGVLSAQLNGWFPQYRHSCHYPGDCQFLKLCFGSAEYAADPVATGDFEYRAPNHPNEFEKL